MRRLFGCPDIVSLTDKFLMARNFFRIFTENNPVMGYSKTFFIPEAKGLTVKKSVKNHLCMGPTFDQVHIKSKTLEKRVILKHFYTLPQVKKQHVDEKENCCGLPLK